MGNSESFPEDGGGKERSTFPGSAFLDNAMQCGSIEDVEESSSPNSNSNTSNKLSKLLGQAETLCSQSPTSEAEFGKNSFDDEYEPFRKQDDIDNIDEMVPKNMNHHYQNPPPSPGNPTSALFARALVSEVTDNPKTMTPAAMAEREKKLLKAQERARKPNKKGDTSRPVGAPGGIGQPSVLGSLAHALTGTTDPLGQNNGNKHHHHYNNDNDHGDQRASVLPPNSMSENRAQVDSNTPEMVPGKHTVTIGLSLSRRSSVGHPDTVTRQTAFDFNELQDRQYKYVSSTDSSGWRAGGGERGGPQASGSTEQNQNQPLLFEQEDEEAPFGGNASFQNVNNINNINNKKMDPGTPSGGQNHKVAAPDTVHIPIIHIDADSPQAVDAIIAALARGEVFIPHMAIIPEALSVNGVSPPDLVVRFGTERNDDLPPDEWPNWCLEFMHNQLYEYFHGMGARWMKRPFSITLAKKVRWKTVKHMNRYFAHAERVIDAWREKGPQYLDPQLAYIEGGATPEEVARPHGLYLLRNGVPTNYFAPNFDPPYTTKMTRSLLLNVLGKSWDKKRREWTSEPIPRLVTPAMLVTAMCGCSDTTAGGFIASEVTLANRIDTSTIPQDLMIRSDYNTTTTNTNDTNPLPPTTQQQQRLLKKKQQQQQQQQQEPPPDNEPADTDIMSEVIHGPREPPPSYTGGEQLYQRPEKLSLEKLSFDDNRRPVDPSAFAASSSSSSGGGRGQDVPADTQQPQLSVVTSPTRSTFSKQSATRSTFSKQSATRSTFSKQSAKTLDEEFQELDESTSQSIDLHMSTSTASTTASSNHHQNAPAPPSSYGRAPPPTPERMRVPSPQLGDENGNVDRRFHQEEEPTRGGDPDAASNNANNNIQSLDFSMETGATSDFVPASTTGTNSTIMHMNLSTEAIVKRELERRQGRDEKKEEDVRGGVEVDEKSKQQPRTMASDEDWLDEMGKPMPSPAMTTQKAAKKSKNKNKEAVEKERARQIELIAMAQAHQAEGTHGDHLMETLNNPKKVELARAVMMQSSSEATSTSTKIKTKLPGVQRNDSGVSLEYSLDSGGGDNSTLGGSTLMGQQFATEGSVATASTKGSRQARQPRKETTTTSTTQSSSGTNGSKRKDDDELTAFSQSSTYSMDVVPTDEELFSVGWAKALDPKSGSYYYFTLDRTKTVWDNPLPDLMDSRSQDP